MYKSNTLIMYSILCVTKNKMNIYLLIGLLTNSRSYSVNVKTATYPSAVAFCVAVRQLHEITKQNPAKDAFLKSVE